MASIAPIRPTVPATAPPTAGGNNRQSPTWRREAGEQEWFAGVQQAVARGVARPTAAMRVPGPALRAALEEAASLRVSGGTDRFGRRFAGVPLLQPPHCAVRVTGALFHTQGGLVVDGMAAVLDARGRPFPNLFAAGGTACGVSGRAASDYLSGNGLLSAVALGRVACQSAARCCRLDKP